MKKTILIILSCILLVIISAVATYFTLLQTGAVVSEKINITLKLKDVEKEYDGNTYSYATNDVSVTEGSLLSGDYIIFEVLNNYHEVGEYSVSFKADIYNAENVNVSNQYEIKCVNSSLKINKRNLDGVVSSNKLTNGLVSIADYVLTNDTSLLPGHHLSCIVNEDEYNFIVIDDLGKVVSNNYNINILYQQTPQPLSITFNDITKEYDLKDVNYIYSITSGSLNDGDYLDISYDTDIYDIGSYEIKPEVRVYSKDNEDVTSLYNLTINAGTLTINKRKLNIVGSSLKLEYGDELNIEGYSSQTGLLENHKLEVSYDKLTDTKIGTYKINFKDINIYDETNNDITNNYEISVTPGEVEIVKRNLYITLPTLEHIYDGKLPDLSNIESSNLLASDKIMGIYYEDLDVNVGNYDLLLKQIVIYNAENENVAANYNIISTPGKLDILPRDISIQTINLELTYGDTLSTYTQNISDDELGTITANISFGDLDLNIGDNKVNNCIVNLILNNQDVTKNFTINTENITINLTPRTIQVFGYNFTKTYDGKTINLNGKYDKVYGLVYGDYIKFVTYKPLTNYNVGIYNLEIDEVIIYNNDGEDVSEFYNINKNVGSLTINKRNLNIVGQQVQVQYGDSITITNYASQNGLLDGETIDVVYDNDSLTNANVGTYKVDFTVKVLDTNDQDVTSNYEITKTSGEVEIVKRNLYITLPDKTHTYNGKLPDGLAEVQSNNLLPSHKVTNVYYENLDVNVGNYDLLLKEIIIRDENNIDVTSNYNIITSPGTLTISPRPITIGNTNLELTYGDTLGTYTQNISDDELGTITANISFGDLDLNIGENKAINYSVNLILNNEEVTKNFTINTENITINLAPRTIQVFGYNFTKTYDGKTINLNGKYYKVYGLVYEDHIYNVTYSNNDLINVGTYDLEIAEVIIYNNDGEDVTEFYELSRHSGTLTINKRTLNVIGNNISVEYGEEIDLTGYASQNGLLDGETIDVVYDNDSLTNANVGTYKVDFTVKVLDANHQDVTSNYEITKTLGEVEITKCDITEEIKEKLTLSEITYNGEYVDYQEVELTKFGLTLVIGYKDKNYNNVIPRNAADYKTYPYMVYGTGISNYSYEENLFGSFTINKADLEISLNEEVTEFTYNGEFITYYENVGNYSFNGLYDEVSSIVVDYDNNTNLVNNKILKAGSYNLTLTGLNFTDKKILDNYNITFEPENKDITILVNPREITLVAESMTVTSEEDIPNYVDYILMGSIGKSDYLNVETYVSQNPNNGSYATYIDSHSITHILDDGREVDVTDCYIVDDNPGTITIIN